METGWRPEVSGGLVEIFDDGPPLARAEHIERCDRRERVGCRGRYQGHQRIEQAIHIFAKIHGPVETQAQMKAVGCGVAFEQNGKRVGTILRPDYGNRNVAGSEGGMRSKSET